MLTLLADELIGTLDRYAEFLDGERAFDPNQPRDKYGKWTDVPGVAELIAAARGLAKKLNDGKKLNADDPLEAQMAGAIYSWTGGNPGAAPSTPKMFKEDVSHTIRTDPTAATDAGLFARAVAAAPADAPTLYRGMKNVDPGDIPREGQTFDLGLTSFTRDRGVMDDFTTLHHEAQAHGHIVRTRIAKGSRALRIDHQADAFKREREHVGMGRYRVTRRRDSVKRLKIDGEFFEVRITDLEVEQIDDMTGEPTFIRERDRRPVVDVDYGN